MNGNMTMTEMIMVTSVLPDRRDYYLNKLLEIKTILFITCAVFLGIYKLIKKSKRASLPPVDDIDDDVDYKALYEFLLLDSEDTLNELERVRSELEKLKEHKCPKTYNIENVIEFLGCNNVFHYTGGNPEKYGDRKYFHEDEIIDIALYYGYENNKKYFEGEEISSEPSEEIAKDKITITTYSDRSVVIRGNTKQLKEKLKELNCRWNPNLDGGAGWIASKKKLDKIKTELKQYM
jgi:hypothetical protein